MMIPPAVVVFFFDALHNDAIVERTDLHGPIPFLRLGGGPNRIPIDPSAPGMVDGQRPGVMCQSSDLALARRPELATRGADRFGKPPSERQAKTRKFLRIVESRVRSSEGDLQPAGSPQPVELSSL